MGCDFAARGRLTLAFSSVSAKGVTQSMFIDAMVWLRP